MSIAKNQSAPKELQKNPTGEILRRSIWQRCREDKHFMGAIVGREGSGKSYTALRIAELCDPDFGIEQVCFKPANFLELMKSDKLDVGSVVILDEAGVGVGNRTWYDRDQVLLNQTLQTIRDDNMAALFTLPRLSELDKQARGRLLAFLELTEMKRGEYVRGKWKFIQPSRDGNDKLYKKYPRLRVDGKKQRITSVGFTPPSQELTKSYEDKKAEFKDELYDRTIGELRDGDENEEKDANQLAEKIMQEHDLDEFVDVHGGNGTKFINHRLIQLELGINEQKAKRVKTALKKESDI